MQEKKITIVNRLGLHARAAAKFVNLASSFACDVVVSSAQREANGKSIMGVMMLAAGKGTEIGIRTEGSDDVLAMEKLEQLIQERFGEDD